MTYDYFIGMVRHYQTARIHAVSGSQQTNPEHVPAAFALLMPQIISILDQSLDDICDSDQSIVIFGLQPATRMIASNLPLEKERFVEGLLADYHLCCTLDFFKVPMIQVAQTRSIDNTESWFSTDSVVIDFTSGEMMDSDKLLEKLHYLPPQGKIYGVIQEDALEIAWTIAKIKQTKHNGKGFLFNNYMMQPVSDVA